MAKRKKQKKSIKRSSLGFKGIIGLIIVVVFFGTILLFAFRSNQSFGETALVDTIIATPIPENRPTPILTAIIPTSTLTPSPSPTHTSTSSPTASPFPTPTNTLQLATKSISTVATPTPIIKETVGIPVYTYKVLNTYPHDRNAFTQGLIFQDNILYEGTGRRGQSTLRKVELETGNVFQLHRLADQLFGEGVTIFGNRIIQLTWQSHIGFVYDKNTFELQQEFIYPTEGWGLTHDGEHLIMSDGTPNLYFLDPETFEEIGRIEVHDNNGPVIKLNELEYIHGDIFANIWQTDRIAKINPKTGQVVGWIDLAGLLAPEDYNQPVDVLNGIAYDFENERLFVTGKLWPKLFEIELIALE